MSVPSKPITIVVDDRGNLSIASLLPEPPAHDGKERKARIARCGHIKRRLVRGERLTGKLLTYALDVIRDDVIAAKLQAGDTLTDYEMHLVLDLYLLHERLRA
jgi:hypothetical protein